MALTLAQELHNRMVDFDIEMAKREFEQREETARLLNEMFCKQNPDAPEWMKRTYGMNMIGKRKVIALKYVE